MKKLILAWIIIPLVLSAGVKPEEYVKLDVENFEVISTESDPRFGGFKFDPDLWFLDFPEIGASINISDGVDMSAIREAELLTVGYIRTKTMEYLGGGRWGEADYVEIIDVSTNRKQLIDRSICDVHGMSMTREALPTIYGLPTEEDTEKYFKKYDTYPNGLDVAFEGCIVPDPPYESVYRFVCPECRRIYTETTLGEQDGARNPAKRDPRP